MHGEADAICRRLDLLGSQAPRVLDAGCGTGRVAIELDRRSIDVTGVDLDDGMLAAARANAPHIEWVQGDLANLALDSSFDLIAAPGNVMIFLAPGTEAQTIGRLAAHLNPGGVLVAGFQLGRSVTLDDYDRWCSDAGLSLLERHATWDGQPFDGGDYAVSYSG